ncbi:MAG: penicillin-binding protein 2 [Nitrospinaceae bacterium]|nr:penicillin-binding protein 2 [Nitrospinaceae bacterium]NIR57321.1 penicillin-binding protein 2 [Nitrospinaceae bacterium]NIS87773.1 penicillin-binding protein 2 [Nitrospinaceae bacterium]NIT84643.1 penicillin-binding protein 2 [Nitrospinaceae bacterium]NIU46822.1 penicillin-binding protein 2 [Nitrospinaceae bacterium]
MYTPDFSDTVRRKIKFFAILVIVCFLGLWLRVWYLQVLKGADFMGLSENNRVRMVSLPSYRGEITDRNGVTLVSIRPSFNLYVTPEDTHDLKATLEILKDQIDFDPEKLTSNIRNSPPFADVLIKADIDRSKVAFIEENNGLLPGIHLKVEPLRDYLYQDLASHIFGYLGEINKDKLKEAVGYRMGDMVGKEGIEFLYESDMKGKKGYKEIEVDVSGRELTTLRKKPPQSGHHLVLTLDLRIQKVVEQLMTGTEEEPINGAVVVMKVQTGEILAMTSKPSFDPNLFASGISVREWRKLLLNNQHPLQNKAIDGQYPPGSVYKIVAALAVLEEKIMTPEATVFCPGYFRMGRGIYRCWNRGGHGAMNLHDALVQSCDVYFYTVGHRLGVDTLGRYARMLGFGDLTHVNLIGEKPGLVPTKEWKLNMRKEAWLPGETISLSIGQGFNLVTPIQQARMMAAVTNGGMLLKPYLVKQIKDKDGRVVRDIFPTILQKVESRPETLTAIQEALLGVVNGKRGTGWRARLKNIKMAGKTGTAQVVRLKVSMDNKEEKTPYQFRDHAWFVGFAPYENPEIAIAVIVEHGGHGGSAAAPIFRKIVETYNKYYPIESKKEEPL